MTTTTADAATDAGTAAAERVRHAHRGSLERYAGAMHSYGRRLAGSAYGSDAARDACDNAAESLTHAHAAALAGRDADAEACAMAAERHAGSAETGARFAQALADAAEVSALAARDAAASAALDADAAPASHSRAARAYAAAHIYSQAVGMAEHCAREAAAAEVYARRARRYAGQAFTVAEDPGMLRLAAAQLASDIAHNRDAGTDAYRAQAALYADAVAETMPPPHVNDDCGLGEYAEAWRAAYAANNEGDDPYPWTPRLY